MKISLDELFLYRQYPGYPVEFYFDRKKNNIVSKEDVDLNKSCDYRRYIPLYSINQEQIELSFILQLNDKKILSQYKNRNTCFEEFLQKNNLYYTWWKYYKNTVINIIIQWCEENKIHYVEQYR